MIMKLIKYPGNDDNMSIMEEQFDMTAGFYCLGCETEPLCVQSLSQH